MSRKGIYPFPTLDVDWFTWKLSTASCQIFACPTGDDDCGGCAWDEEPYCGYVAGGAYCGGFGF